MPVFVVSICRNFKRSGLNPSAQTGCLGLGILLRKHGGNVKFAKLQLGFYTKQGTGPVDKGVLDRHTDVSGFEAFDDFVFFAFVAQFYGFGIEIKSGFGVVIHIDVDFVAHLTVDTELYALVKIKKSAVTSPFRQRRIVNNVVFDTKTYFG